MKNFSFAGFQTSTSEPIFVVGSHWDNGQLYSDLTVDEIRSSILKRDLIDSSRKLSEFNDSCIRLRGKVHQTLESAPG